jgi:molecular chaperone Hsp33
MKQAIVALGPEEIRHIIEGRESVEISCQFCNRTYTFRKPELSRLLEEMA